MGRLAIIGILKGAKQTGIAANKENTILITGLPRSGTTLVCKLLSSLPDMVALNEPMKIRKLAGLNEKQKIQTIYSFANRCRKSLVKKGKAPSMHIKKEIPGNMFSGCSTESGLRKINAKKGNILIHKDLPEDFILAIKHNLGFTAILPALSSAFNCYGIIRNPLSVLASWHTINMPISQGYVPLAEMMDGKLKASLSSMNDVIDRQIHILNWFFGIFQKTLPIKNIIRYEEIISSNGSCLTSIIPGATFQGINLRSNNNNNPAYNKNHMQIIQKRLLEDDGPFLEFYAKKEIESLLDSWI